MGICKSSEVNFSLQDLYKLQIHDPEILEMFPIYVNIKKINNTNNTNNTNKILPRNFGSINEFVSCYGIKVREFLKMNTSPDTKVKFNEKDEQKICNIIFKLVKNDPRINIEDSGLI